MTSDSSLRSSSQNGLMLIRVRIASTGSPRKPSGAFLYTSPRVSSSGCSHADPFSITATFSSLRLGMRMEVTFEQFEDVWLPFFRPCAAQPSSPAPLPPDDIEPGDYARHVRPMVRREKFEDKAAITGIGQSQLGRRLMRSPLSLPLEACTAAVADAGLTMSDIDGLATYPGNSFSAFSEGGVSAIESALGIRPTWYSGGFETFGPGGSVIDAMMAVASGMAKHVLCFRTVWEPTYGELAKKGMVGAGSGLEGGKNITRDGVLPLNTHGGQLSHGRTHGLGLVHEAVTQLRGAGGDRQVANAKVAAVPTGGWRPAASCCCGRSSVHQQPPSGVSS